MNMIAPRTVAEEALGINLPSRRDEDWKWTDLRRLIDKPMAPVKSKPSAKDIERLIAASPLSAMNVHRIVIVNGVMDAKHSKLQGLNLSHVAPAIAHDDPLLSLNAKLKAKTVALAFSGNVDVPVEILCITIGQGESIASRLHVSVAEGASATIIETFVGEGEYLNNPVTTLTLAKGARLDRVKIENDAAKAQHLSHVIVTLAEGSNFNDFTLTSGAALNRQNGTIEYHGPNAKAQVSGSYLLKGKQHADTCLVVDHKVPHCVSRELFKCVMDNNARGIFQGKVIVRPDAQKTDGKQSSHALLLSETAEFDAKPELEIYADDVVCGHGTTCGDLNHDHLFYLRSRGIPESEARTMLVQAFVAEAFETVENEAVREALMGMVEARLSA
jgi:Fe-S cluster assembly protein SufD